MNLPDWATHVAVDEDGEVCVFGAAPKWEDADEETCGMWTLVGGQSESLSTPVHYNQAVLPSSVARLLCVAIPRPEREEQADDA